MLVLIAANLRLMVENVMKYGLLIRAPFSLSELNPNWPCAVCYFEMVSLVVLAWAVERHVAPKLGNDLMTNLLHATVIFAIVAVPVWTIFRFPIAESNSVLLLLFSLSWGMKLVSFAHTCFDIRRAIARGIVDRVCRDDAVSKEVLEEKGFPECLTLKNMLLFLAYPTLCFQLHYPRLPRMRRRRLMRNIAALALCGLLGYIILEQYIQPLLRNARKYVQMEPNAAGEQVLKINVLGLVERLLKLSLPNLYVWLLIFYALFHCWLNVLGELTQFGDRRFYGDWWNAASFAEYWKRWNLPVHHWCLRHIYFPMMRRGWSQLFSGFTVFLISGLLHELLVVVPLRLNRPTVLVTLAFLAQLPLTIVTARPFFERRHRMLGNLFFWFAFCFSGQPAAILIYFLIAVAPEFEMLGSLMSLR